MTENNQPAEAPPRCRTIKESVYLEANGLRYQVAQLELKVPEALSEPHVRLLTRECSSVMRKAAEYLGESLLGDADREG